MDLSKYTNQQLKTCLQELKDKTSGNKHDLMLRLQAHDKDLVAAILSKFPERENTSLLDTSLGGGSSEDQIAVLKGEVATLTATVNSLVQSLQKLLPGTNGNLAVQGEVAEASSATETVGANRVTQEPLINLQEQNIEARPSGSGVLCTHQVNQMNPNENVAHEPGSGVLSTHSDGMSYGNAAVRPQALSVGNQVLQSPVTQTLRADAMNYEPHVHGTRRVQQNDDVMYDEGFVHGVLQNAVSMQPVRPRGGGFPADSLPHSGHMGTMSSGSVRTTMEVRDMVRILPEYFPGRGLSSVMFIERINQLRRVYNWSDDMLLYAIYDQLKGPAKTWMNSMPIFQRWNDFVREFLLDFPCEVNTAELNIKMMRSRMHREETYADYYYRMLSMGRSGEMADSAIITYIINGLNDDAAKKFLSAMSFMRCADLLRALLKLNMDVRKPYAPQNLINNSQSATLPQNKTPNNINANKQSDRAVSGGPICFRCRNRGHVARNCPKRNTTDRVNIVQDVEAVADDVVINNISQEVKPQELVKAIAIKGEVVVECKALIDTGSGKSLIKRLAGFAGGRVDCWEKVKTVVQLDDVEYSAELLIVEDSQMLCDVLVGIDILSQSTVVIDRGVCHVLPINFEQADVESDLSEDIKGTIYETLQKFSHCFGDKIEQLGASKNFKMEITLSSNVPISLKPYPVPIPKQNAVEKIVDKLLEKGIIEHSQSKYSSPIVLVKKSNGEDRLCIDYRKINSITDKQPWQMPTVDGVLATLSGKFFFTTLDMMMGYYQLQMHENSRQYTAFVTHHGHFQFIGMPFGLRNAPSAFQKMMTLIRPLGKSVTCYVDEIVIATKTAEENIEVLNKLLKLVEGEGLTLRLSKCAFLKRSVAFLGHVVDQYGIRPGEQKTLAIKTYPAPCSQVDVRRFLGLAGYFRKFIPRFGIIAKPLTDMLKKDVKFVWTEDCATAFLKLKTMLTAAPVLAVYDANKTHELHTDASSVGLAAILLQSEDDAMKPVSYFSRTCTAAEKNYHAYELETLAVVQACERFRSYLLGKHFTIITDCQAISSAKANKQMVPRIARWFLKLTEYDFDLIHRPGESMRHVDAMSRAPAPVEEEATDVSASVLSINMEDWVSTLQARDEKIKFIMDVLSVVQVSDQQKQIASEYQLVNHRLFKKLAVGKRLLVVPKGLRWRVAKLCHDDMGHPGVDGSVKRVMENFWFPRVRNFIKNYIKSCVDCSYHREPRVHQGELFGMEVPKIPFQVLHMDHLGPFVKSRLGNEYVLVIVDAMSRYAIIVPTKSTKTKPVLDALNQLTMYFGLPQKIITDRGTAFTSGQFAEYCVEQDIQHIKVAVRTPRANGLAERINQEVLKFLKPSVIDERGWDNKLRQLQWTLNTRINSTTKMAAIDLIFDFPLRDLSGNKLLNALKDETFIQMNNRREEAIRNINKAREMWQKKFNEKHQKPLKYAVGELVLLQMPAQSTGQSRKLLPIYKGPYQVERVLRFDRYIVTDVEWLKKSQRTFSTVATVDKMKPWCALVPEIDSDYDEDEQGNQIKP